MPTSNDEGGPTIPGDLLLLRELWSGSVKRHATHAVWKAANQGAARVQSELEPLMTSSEPLADAIAGFAATAWPGEHALRPTLARQIDGQMPAVPTLPGIEPLRPDGVGLIDPMFSQGPHFAFSNAVSPVMLARTRHIYRWWGYGDGDMRWCLWGIRSARCSRLAGIPSLYEPLVDLLLPSAVGQDFMSMARPPMHSP